MMELKELCNKAHGNAKNKGFWDNWHITKYNAEFYKTEIAKEHLNDSMGNKLMLIVSELAEAQEALRNKDWDNFKEELADVAIRLGDLCGGLGIDLEEEILKKMEKNEKRPYKHGKEF